MQSESAIDREKIATGGENPDLGPEVDIKDLTKRNDEIKKGLQGRLRNQFLASFYFLFNSSVINVANLYRWLTG